jgi:hypothetical protein
MIIKVAHNTAITPNGLEYFPRLNSAGSKVFLLTVTLSSIGIK